MVEHFVLFTLKEDVTDAQYAELERAIYGLSGLPGCTRLTFGRDHVLTRGRGYTHALMTRHASRAAAAAYQLDPEHVRVRDAVIAPLLQRDGAGKPVLLSVDFEAKVAEPTRWSVLLAGAALGASAAVVLRKLAN